MRKQRIGKQAVFIANSLVNLSVLLMVMLLTAFGCYALWDSTQVYSEAATSKYEVYKPDAEEEAGELSFATLQEMNSEVTSWLTVYGTNIDYPVAQAKDNNMKYVNTNAEGDYSLSGSIFLDAENAGDYSDFNSIIYGHHMEKKTMFGEIGLFAEQSYFDERLYGNLYYGGEDHGLEFFAFLHVDAYDNMVFAPGVPGEEKQESYLGGLLSRAVFIRNIGITTQDRIVLLSTCSAESTNGRDILLGRISNTTFVDPFIKEEKPTTAADIPMADRQSNTFGIPSWIWNAVPYAAIFLFLIILLFIMVNRNARVKSHTQLQKIAGSTTIKANEEGDVRI